MTKEITKASILQQTQDKFGLREYTPDAFLFSETVIPTYDIGQHVQRWELELKRVSITSEAGFVFFTVPDTERWSIRAYNIIFLGAGAIKVSGVYIVRKDYPSRFLHLDLILNQAVSYVVNLPQLVVLNSGDTICVLCDEYTSTQSLDLFVDVMKEEIR